MVGRLACAASIRARAYHSRARARALNVVFVLAGAWQDGTSETLSRILLLPIALLVLGCSTVLGLEPGIAESSDGGEGDPLKHPYRVAVLDDVPSAYYPFDEPAGAMTVRSLVSGSGAEWQGFGAGALLGAPGV